MPSAPLKEGTRYHLTYKEACGTPKDVSVEFDVGPRATLPIAAGTLSGKAPVVGQASVSSSRGSCFEEAETVRIDLLLTPTAELLAFAPLTSFTMTIDGQKFAAKYYGKAKREGDGLIVGTLEALCSPSSSALTNAKLGVHTIGIQAHVAGAASDPPEVTTTLMLSCTGESVDAGPTADGGAPAPDGGEPASDGGHLESPDASSGPNASSPSSSEGSGCSVGRGNEAPWGHAGTLFFGVALVAGARSIFRRRARR